MDFGFSLSPSSAIELDTLDTSLFRNSATCTAAEHSGMSVRKLLLGLQRGKKAEVERMLSNCMLCGKCTMVCPRGINTRRVILTVCRLYDNMEGAL